MVTPLVSLLSISLGTVQSLSHCFSEKVKVPLEMAAGQRRPKYYLYIDGCYSKKGQTCTLNEKNLNKLLDYARTTSENISFIFQYLGSCTKRHVQRNRIPYLQVSCEIYRRLFYECFPLISSCWYTLLIDVSLLLLASSSFTIWCMGLDLFATFYAIPINVSYILRTISHGKKLATSSLHYVNLPMDRTEAVATLLRNNQEHLLRGINSLATCLTRFNPIFPLLEMVAIHFASTRCFLWLYFTYCTLLLNAGEASINYRNLAGALLVAYTISKNVDVLDNLSAAIQPSVNIGQVLLQRNVEVLLDYYNLYQRVLNNAVGNKSIMLRGPMTTPRGLPSSFVETEKDTPWSNLITVLECSANMSANAMVVTDINLLFEWDRSSSFPRQGVLCYWRLIIKSLSLIFREQKEDANKSLLTEDRSSTSLMLIEEPALPIDCNNAARVLALFSKTRTEILFRLIHSVCNSNHILIHAPSIFHWVQHHTLTSQAVSATMLRLLVLELIKFRQMCLLAGTGMQISNVYLHGTATALLMDSPYMLFSLILATAMSQSCYKDISLDMIKQLLTHCAEPDTLEAGFLVDYLVPADAHRANSDVLLLQMRSDVSIVAIELLGSLPYLNNELSRTFLRRLYKLLYHLRTFYFTKVSSLDSSVHNLYDTFLSKVHNMLLQHAIVIVSSGFSNARLQLDVILKSQNNILSFSTGVERRDIPQGSSDRLRDEPSSQSRNTTVLIQPAHNHQRLTSTLTNATLYDRRISITDDADLLSLTSFQSLLSLQSLGLKSNQYDSRPYIFECVKTSRLWEVLTKVASSCFHDKLSNVKYSVDYLITDFIGCSSFRALVTILHESSMDNNTLMSSLAARRPSALAQAHLNTPFDSNITNSALFHEPSVNLFEQLLLQNHEVSAEANSSVNNSAGICYNNGDPNGIICTARSSVSVRKSTPSVTSSQMAPVSSYLAAIALVPVNPQTSSQPVREELQSKPKNTAASSAKNNESNEIDAPESVLAPHEEDPLKSRQLHSSISNYALIATILSETTLMRTLLSCAQGQTIFYLLLIYSNLMGDTLRLNENQGGFLSTDLWRTFSHLVGNLLTGGIFIHKRKDDAIDSVTIPVFLLYEHVNRLMNSRQIASDHELDLGFVSAPIGSMEPSLDELESFKNILFMNSRTYTIRPYALTIFERVLEELPKTSNYDTLPHVIHAMYPDTAVPLPLGYIMGIILVSAPTFDEASTVFQQNSVPLPPIFINDQIMSSFAAGECNNADKNAISNATLNEYYFSEQEGLSSIKKDTCMQPCAVLSKSVYESVTQLRRSISVINNKSLFNAKPVPKKDTIKCAATDSILKMNGRVNDDKYISRSLLTARDSNYINSQHGNKSSSPSARGSIDRSFPIEVLQDSVISIARTYISLITVISLAKNSTKELIDDLYVKVPLSTIALWIFHNKTLSGDSILACFVILFIYICGRDPPDDNMLFQAYQRPPPHAKKSTSTVDIFSKASTRGLSPVSELRVRRSRRMDMFDTSEVKAFVTELCKRYKTLRHFFRTNVSKLLSVLFEALYKHAELSKKLDSHLIDGISTLSSRMAVCCNFLECNERPYMETLILSAPSSLSSDELLRLAKKLSQLRVSSVSVYFKKLENHGDNFNFAEEAQIIKNKLVAGSMRQSDKPITLSKLYFDHYILPGMIIKRMLIDQLSCVGTLITQPSIEFIDTSSILLDKNFPKYALPDRQILISDMLSKAARLPFSNSLYILSILTGIELTFQLSGELYTYANLQALEARHTRTADQVFHQTTPCDTILSTMAIEANDHTLAQKTYAFILDFGSPSHD